MTDINVANPFSTVEVTVPVGSKIALQTYGADQAIIKIGDSQINGTTIFSYLDTT